MLLSSIIPVCWLVDAQLGVTGLLWTLLRAEPALRKMLGSSSRTRVGCLGPVSFFLLPALMGLFEPRPLRLLRGSGLVCHGLVLCPIC